MQRKYWGELLVKNDTQHYVGVQISVENHVNIFGHLLHLSS